MSHTTLTPKEFSKRVKLGMREAKKRKVHIGRPPRLFQRSHAGTLYMRKEVKTFLKQFFAVSGMFTKTYEYQMLLILWYENKYYKKSVPTITIEDLKIIRTEPLRTKYQKFVKSRSMNPKQLAALFADGPSYGKGM